MLRLHDSASSGNAYKVRLLLTQLGIPFERIEYDIDHGATRTPEFLRSKNANGRVPVLELDDGRCLAESNAIICYLAEGTPLLPRRQQRALAARAGDAVAVLRAIQPRAEHRHRPLLDHAQGADERRAAGGAAGQAQVGNAALAVMDGHLRNRASSPASATRSPTSRCTRTHTSRPKAASTSPPTRPCARGWRASPSSLGTSRSRTNRALARRQRRPRRPRRPSPYLGLIFDVDRRRGR